MTSSSAAQRSLFLGTSTLSSSGRGEVACAFVFKTQTGSSRKPLSCRANGAAVGRMRRRIGGPELEILDPHSSNNAVSESTPSPRHDSSDGEAAETVPAVATLDVLQRTALTARTILTYLGDQRTRAGVLARLASLMDSLNSLNSSSSLNSLSSSSSLNSLSSSSSSLNSSHPAGGEMGAPLQPSMRRRISGDLPSSLEPNMLEVEIRSIVDEAAAEPSPELAVTVDRPALVGSMADFIRARERLTQEAQDKMQMVLEASKALTWSLIEAQKRKSMHQDLEDSAAVSTTLMHLQKSQALRRRREIVGTTVALEKLRGVQREQQELQAERSQVAREVSDLQWDLGDLALSAKLLEQERHAAEKRPAGSPVVASTALGGNGGGLNQGQEEDQRRHLGPEVHAQSEELQQKLGLLKVLWRKKNSGPKSQLSTLQGRVKGLEGQLENIAPGPLRTPLKLPQAVLLRASSRMLLGVTVTLATAAIQASMLLQPNLQSLLPQLRHLAHATLLVGGRAAAHCHRRVDSFQEQGGFEGLKERFEQQGGLRGLQERFEASGGVTGVRKSALAFARATMPAVRDEVLSFLFLYLPLLLTNAKATLRRSFTAWADHPLYALREGANVREYSLLVVGGAGSRPMPALPTHACTLYLLDGVPVGMC